MDFRVGVNMGDVATEGGRIYGDGVNIAARLEALAEAGGVCISATVQEQVRNKLDAGFTDRIILSQDWVVNLAAWGDEIKEASKRSNPDRFLFITRHVLPRLREMGVVQEVIDRITIENPRRFLEGAR